MSEKNSKGHLAALYCRAMLAMADTKWGRPIGYPNAHVRAYNEGQYTVTETRYFDERASWFFGTIVISRNNETLWVMQYQGHSTDEDAAAFLRQVLADTWKKNTFLGGRGPRAARDSTVPGTETFDYANHLDVDSTEQRFRGTVHVRERGGDGRDLIYCEYSGGLVKLL